MILGRRDAVGLLAAAPVACVARRGGTDDPSATALRLRGADILDPRTGTLQRRTDLWISGASIGAVAPSRAAARRAPLIDLSGKTALPGLCDMHAHLPDAEPDDARTMQQYLALQLAAGVTTVRSMRGTPTQLRWRDRIDAGEVLGPRLVVGGVIGDVGPREASRQVRGLARQGYDFVKLLGDVGPEAFEEIVRAAAEAGLPVAGHTPNQVGLRRVLDSGLCIEHIGALVGRDLPTTPSSSTFVCPTLDYATIVMGLRPAARLRARQGLDRLPPRQLDQWEAWMRAQRWTRAELDRANVWLAAALRAIAALDASGARLLISPSHGPWIVPGFGFHEELALFERAGLERAAILRAATTNAARWLGDAPHRADLIVVDADPRRDLATLRDPFGVLVRGQWIPTR